MQREGKQSTFKLYNKKLTWARLDKTKIAVGN